MGNFDRGNRRSGGGSGRSFGGKRSFGGQRPSGRDDRGGRDGGRPMMHRAICSECGDSCEVPFKPTGSKPVFCSNCFSNQEGGRDSRGGRDDRGGRSSSFGGGRDKHRDRDINREMFDVVCSKCGKDCQVPFRPTSDKPLFCNDCFGKDKGSVGRGSSEVVDQIKLLNKKIDQLVEMLSANGSNKKKEKSEVKTDVEVKEPVKTVEKKEEKKPKKEKKPAEKKTKKVKK
ncbi:MAG: hypothetical protein A2725_03850 [Candidatus Magasanikbacteria bacterium RIFCSPHIGHO2_01_FULL_33_34]|uniref:CxxC-x17-CxxC domain-containing protein n=1 Tax=Candidatus Magasanikbacteria bacterium RIFCSPHIGHO2_01_FULL_33_34 TaxID=1798671 RepID=A0A1F6LHN5_9BACT|nr:MAG: hypothetical protein A2725_03850 [Candidatus Magasanikbacteria bacterium RIFCSPHIGHO2_01_FULL_33_34]OGH65104.1 MAG: hypothetical protein A3B83_03610 [Candidatus Magasanikbacteria bacterium RIFCSPHIGHO2_02_FULL_33_17]OGH75352.1 MAG: hypothetical protein A3A89_04555 [Candidatus Magasanikbacteria bacterium RIFCSPLOWO2_01_FULL_33_34]OGH81814.1 MAG: hypothetical protein A3F93_03505 [Candidatus Magasanikbacteria bacterium RIFCSPLOWO2_12_FULL_34_7]